MDDTDVKILKMLQENARYSMTELGKQVGLTQPAVTGRVRKLEEQGTISGYKAQLNPSKIGKTVKAFVMVQTQHCKAFSEHCANESDVVDLHRISGEYNYLVKVMTESIEKLEAFTASCTKFGYFQVMVVLSSRIEHNHNF
ncbi:Lrp/AsnC family transcriptional regulator [Paenibacillus gorillae]|uniref:Lrp/AsnC family transcriptional regulator n=1 Tax=Paenibacillus gorillae TaxID=1243662 RepID=UPI0004B3C432|nr:Lrp/AsnC family transcriptional regulator [Paenibacillus gorillae]